MMKSCPLCSGIEMEPVMTCTDHYVSGEKFEIERCTICGLLITQNVPKGSLIDKYYETPDYISHSDTRKGLMNRAYHIVRKHMLSRKAGIVKRASMLDRGTLLDFGTGTGYFADTMNRLGWEVHAIEKNLSARQFAKKQFGLDVTTESALTGYADGMMDVVTLWHVTEHLKNLNETWYAFRRILKKNGVLIVAVPNPDSYDARKYGSMWAAYDVPRHLWHFTPSTMKRLGKVHGFTFEEYHPMPMDAFYVSMLSEKYKGSRLPFVKGLWTGLQAWFSARNRKENSSSLIYVFRKE